MKNIKSAPVLVILLAFVILLAVFVTTPLLDFDEKTEEAASDEQSKEEHKTEQSEKNESEQEKSTAEESGEPYGYDLTEYLTMGDVSPVKAKFDDPEVCTDKEVDAAVFQILLKNATFTEKKEGAKAEVYNRVTVDYQVLQNGKVLEQYGLKDHEIIIGLQNGSEEDLVIGGALVGARVGDVRKKNYTYPEELNGDALSGKKVQFSATVKKIEKHTIPELIDDTVGEFTGNAFSTVKEFRESVKKDILEEKKLAKAKAVWLAIKEDAKVKKYPEKELKSALDLYHRNYEMIADRFDLSLEQLVATYLESDMKTFEAEAQKYAEEKVKNDMILTQLVRLQNVTLSDAEYQEGVKNYYKQEEGDFASLEKFISFYTEENLRRNLLWDKALKLAEENAVQVK